MFKQRRARKEEEEEQQQKEEDEKDFAQEDEDHKVRFREERRECGCTNGVRKVKNGK